MLNMRNKIPVIWKKCYLQITGWNLNFECYFSSGNEKDNSRNSSDGVMAGCEELRDESREI